MSMLSLAGVTKTYGAAAVVDDLNLELQPGEFLSLLGPSGCGKTTTLRMIAGFVTPSSGTIVMNGRPLFTERRSLPPEKRQMSMIFQSYALWPNMTVEQNVIFGLRMRKVPDQDARKRVAEILEIVRLGEMANRLPSELSGGQQQRVALARALVVKPEILLLDEPLSNLDANLREEMRREIRRLHKEFGITSIYVTHDQSEAMTSSDRIAVMKGGRIEQIDDPVRLYSRPATRYVAEFIGRSNILKGRFGGGRIEFDGFGVDEAQVEKHHCPSGNLTYSLRPQSIALHPDSPAGSDRGVGVFGRIVDRAFLGDACEYTFQANGASAPLRVISIPPPIHDAGRTCWLSIDPTHLIPVADAS